MVLFAKEPQIIHGHQLPPEPDPVVNDSTLLGIDVNENGVRDDVERYIYNRFKNFENAHIDRAIAMQYAKATQVIIQEPETAYEKKTYELMDDTFDCQAYYFKLFAGDSWENWFKYSLEHNVFDERFKDIVFNTRERLEAYLKYNDSLSGHIYDSRSKIKEKCNFDSDTSGVE